MADPIREGTKIFLELASEFEGKIDDEKVDQFFQRLMTLTRGLVILDFLDSANWDMIQSFRFDRESKNLSLIWHDYEGQEESEEEKSLRKLAFPGDSYELHIKLRSIEVIRGKSFCIFVLNGYATEDKELKKLYGGEADEFHFDNESFFSKGIYRKRGTDWRVIRAHHTPLYSIAILPKNCGMSALDSKKVLYLKNYEACEERLRAVIDELDKVDTKNEDAICEKANSIRRILENALKVECSFNDVMPKKGYSHLRLGDLVSLIKDGKDEAETKILNQAVISLNQLSHDSGHPVKKQEAQVVAVLVLCYLRLRPYEVKYGKVG